MVRFASTNDRWKEAPGSAERILRHMHGVAAQLGSEPLTRLKGKAGAGGI
jgi:hypothetical protein